jgi:hypothetical protein
MSSPSHAEFSTISVPEGHVALVLLREENPSRSFYLETPLEVVKSSCLKPRKYLVFLGWCIFGDEGVLALEYGGSAIDTDGDLDDQGVYYYVCAGLGTVVSFATQLLSCVHTYGILSFEQRSRPCCRP